jgi:hypothetical protein
MRATAAIVSTAALAITVQACGGSGQTRTTFKQAFSVQRAKLRVLGDDVGAAVATARQKTDAMLASEFRLLAERATALAGALGGLSAPAQYRADLGSLQSSVTQIAGTLHSIQAAAISHDADAARAGGETIVADAAQVKNDAGVLSARLGLPASP